MRVHALIGALAIIFLCGTTITASAEETAIRVGNIDAVLTTPANVERRAFDRGIGNDRSRRQRAAGQARHVEEARRATGSA
jgi:hypothetical protein